MAGGAGTRLRAAIGSLPKALVPFAGGTLLDHQLARIAPLRPQRVVVVLHHRAHHIQARLPAGVLSIVEPTPLGTAGGLHLLPEGPTHWLVLNVDHISDVDLPALIAAAPAPCVAVLSEVAVPVDEGVVTVEDGHLTDWQERPTLQLPVTCGLYRFQADALRAHLDGTRCDMPALVKRMMPAVRAWPHLGVWIDAGTPARLAAAEAWWGAATGPRRSG